MLSIEQVSEILRQVQGWSIPPNLEEAIDSLAEQKRLAVAAGEEATAKRIWELEQVLQIQRRYLVAFEELKTERYYEAWCSFEQVELNLHLLAPHAPTLMQAGHEYRLAFILEHTERFQSLYPYKIFMSPEIIELEKKCSICNQVISIRHPCGHRVGEVYRGEMCCRIVSRSKFVGTAVVESPIQKYSVPFLVDPETRQSIDHYNYSLVRYVVRRLASPFHGWRYELTKARHPHSRYRDVGRNDQCPCESGRKYKKCCFDEAGVLRPHYEFGFTVPPPTELLGIEYS